MNDMWTHASTLQYTVSATTNTTTDTHVKPLYIAVTNRIMQYFQAAP